MAEQLNPRVTEYFARNDAAAQWWKVDHNSGGRYRKQIEFIDNKISLKGLKAMDVATGLGRFAINFAKSGASHVTAVDISASMVDLARENARQLGVGDKIEFRVGNAAELDFQADQFDLISLMEVLVHLPDPQGVMQSLVKYLKPGGYFITNYDTPAAPKVTYPIDFIWGFFRGLIKNRMKKDVVMLGTVDETINRLESKPAGPRVTRPRDAYRGIPVAEANRMFAAAGIEVVHSLKEKVQIFGITIPITIGYMIIARKK